MISINLSSILKSEVEYLELKNSVSLMWWKRLIKGNSNVLNNRENAEMMWNNKTNN